MNPLEFINQIKDMYNDQDPRPMAQGSRNMYAGGQLVTPSVDGLRPGYQGPKGGKIGDYGKETGRFDTKQLQTAKYAKPYFKEALKTGNFTKIKVATRPDRLKAGYKHTGGVFNSAQIKKFRDVLDSPYLLKLFTKEMGITPKQFRTVVEGGISEAVETKSVASSAKMIGTPSVKLQGQLFDEISNNPDATVKSMAKKFKKTEKEITKMSSRLLKNVYTQNVAILKGKKGPEFTLDNRGYTTLKKWLPSDYDTTKNFLNAFSRIDGLKKVQTENIGLLLQNAYKDKPTLYIQALDNLAAYNKFRDNLPKGFKVDLDHPLSKAFLKGSGVSPDKLLYVTPVDRAFNRGFKEQLDKRYSKALLQGDKTAVKNVRLLADKTGVNIGDVTGKKLTYGAKHLLEKRNFEKEYISNLKSQIKSAEKLKTLQSTEKGQKIIKDVFKGGKVKAIGNVEKLLKSICPKGKKSGGRIGFADGPATVACGSKRLEQIILRGGAKEGEQELAKKILQAGRGLRNMVSLSGMFGPAATAFLVGTEAGLVGYDMISQGKTFREAVGDSVFNYALGDRTKIDPAEERYKRYAKQGFDVNKIRAFEKNIDRIDEINLQYDDLYKKANVVNTKKPSRSKAIEQKQKVISDKAIAELPLFTQDLFRTGEIPRLNKFLEKDYVEGMKNISEADRLSEIDRLSNINPLAIGKIREIEDEKRLRELKLQNPDVRAYMGPYPTMYGFASGGRAGYMGGGIAAIRKPHAIPPERQGLRSIMINVNDD